MWALRGLSKNLGRAHFERLLAGRHVLVGAAILVRRRSVNAMDQGEGFGASVDALKGGIAHVDASVVGINVVQEGFGFSPPMMALSGMLQVSVLLNATFQLGQSGLRPFVMIQDHLNGIPTSFLPIQQTMSGPKLFEITSKSHDFGGGGVPGLTELAAQWELIGK